MAASRPPGWRRWLAFWLIVGGLIAAQVHAVFLETAGLATNPPADRESVSTEIAGPATASQTFHVSAGDFDGVILFARPAGSPVAGDAVLELLEVHPQWETPLVRAVVPAADLVKRDAYAFRFPPVARPAGITFKLAISLPAASAGHGLVLRVVEEDRYPHGVAVVDGRELWGDLAFETRARKAVLINRLDEAFGAYPPWMRSIWFLGAVTLALNACLLWAAWFAVSGPGEEAGPEPVEAMATTWRPGRTLIAWAIGLAVLLAVAAIATREKVQADLVDAFPRAGKRTTMGGLHQGFSIQHAPIEGRLRRCVQALPPSRIVFDVEVPERAEFAAWVGMRPDVWEGPGDGATFRIGFSDGAAYEEPYRRHFYPLDRPADRVLAPVRLDLSKYAGRRIEVVLNTEPSFNAVGDAALWCEPRIVRKGRVGVRP